MKYKTKCAECKQEFETEHNPAVYPLGLLCPECRPRPTIVCLCGSTKFKQEFVTANFRETMEGKIVLSVGWFSHTDGNIFTPSADEKKSLDELHKRKIDLADEVLILNVGGYIGESTRSELEYAKRKGKVIRYLHPELLKGGS